MLKLVCMFLALMMSVDLELQFESLSSSKLEINLSEAQAQRRRKWGRKRGSRRKSGRRAKCDTRGNETGDNRGRAGKSGGRSIRSMVLASSRVIDGNELPVNSKTPKGKKNAYKPIDLLDSWDENEFKDFDDYVEEKAFEDYADSLSKNRNRNETCKLEYQKFEAAKKNAGKDKDKKKQLVDSSVQTLIDRYDDALIKRVFGNANANSTKAQKAIKDMKGSLAEWDNAKKLKDKKKMSAARKKFSVAFNNYGNAIQALLYKDKPWFKDFTIRQLSVKARYLKKFFEGDEKIKAKDFPKFPSMPTNAVPSKGGGSSKAKSATAG